MGSGPWPVAVTAIAGAAAATVAWRSGGKLFVTAVIKGTFALVPGGQARRIEPEPIAVDEELDASGGLRAAGDLAPYVAQTDVWLTGHAPVPQGATGAVPVAFAVAREGVVLLDRALDVALPEGEPPAKVRITGAAPISKRWPARRRLLGDVDPRRLEGRIVEIPEPFDWSYFQVVPPDQRIDALRGDEGISLRGMHPQYAVLATRLPGASAQARFYAESAPLRAGRPIPQMIASTLRIDVDRMLCSVTWRGHFPVSGEDVLGKLHVVAGVALPGQLLDWPDPFAGGAVEATVFDLGATSPAARQSTPSPDQSEKTMDLSTVSKGLSASMPGGAPPAAPDARGGDTLFLDLKEDPFPPLPAGKGPVAPPGNPMGRSPPPPPPPPAMPARAPAARASAPVAATEDLSEIAKRLPQTALPFQQRSAVGEPRLPPGLAVPVKAVPAPPAQSTGTEDLSEIAKRLPQAATPFERPGPGLPAAPPPRSPIPSPPPSMPVAPPPPPSFATPSPSAPSQPFSAPVPPPPPTASAAPQNAYGPEGFGDAFLEAMGERAD